MKMMRDRPAGVLSAGLLLAAAACGPSAATTTNPGVSQGVALVETIRAEDIYERVAFLSADELAGRDTPSPGLETAAAYLVAQYEEMGLEPAGENGTFYQRYPFAVRRIVDGSVVEEESFPPNVVAMVRGSDPRLRDEYVVLSAHFDHVGIGPAIAGDSIYNGADDNGTGTAALLEIAEAFARLPQAPRRSILFLHVSGEEHGLLGSEWYSDHPTVPLDRIVANVNVDMIGRNSPDSIVVIGQGYSSLGDVVNAAAAANRTDLRLTVTDDLWPEERFFFRSDHLHFARNGVPAVFFFAGVHEDYHRPSDTVDKIDPDKTARVARLIYHTVASIANAADRPQWDPAGLAEVRRLTGGGR